MAIALRFFLDILSTLVLFSDELNYCFAQSLVAPALDFISSIMLRHIYLTDSVFLLDYKNGLGRK